jgi:hypothetical protein
VGSLTPELVWGYDTGAGEEVYSSPIAVAVKHQKAVVFQGYNSEFYYLTSRF